MDENFSEKILAFPPREDYVCHHERSLRLFGIGQRATILWQLDEFIIIMEIVTFDTEPQTGFEMAG